MGKTSSKLKLSNAEARHFSCVTHFQPHEVHSLYEDFVKQWPTAFWTREDLRQLYGSIFPSGDHEQFSDIVFDVFDRSKSGTVNFEEFMLASSIKSRGTPSERADWTFRHYDYRCRNKIDREDMLFVANAYLRLRGECRYINGTVKPDAEIETAENYVELFFRAMNVSKGGYISRETFIKKVAGNSYLLGRLELFPQYAYDEPEFDDFDQDMSDEAFSVYTDMSDEYSDGLLEDEEVEIVD